MATVVRSDKKRSRSVPSQNAAAKRHKQPRILDVDSTLPLSIHVRAKDLPPIVTMIDDADADADDDDDDDDDDTAAATDRDLFTAFVHPLTPADFISRCYGRRPFHVSGGGAERVVNVMKAMRNGQLRPLLRDTPSERIHCWMRSSSSMKLESIGLEGERAITDALTLHHLGASLYFRAPDDVAHTLIDGFARHLTPHFAAVYSGGNKRNDDPDRRAEVETFASRAGHITDWHWDYMHNFTIQLSGQKRWSFRRPEYNHPIRGCTPHYTDTSTRELQLKLHTQHITPNQCEPPKSVLEDAINAVTLCAGDVLYHPAGAWHRVECLEDSLSINVSLMSLTNADMMSDVVRQLLWQTELGRAPVTGSGGGSDAAANLQSVISSCQSLIAHTQKLLKRLKPTQIIIPAMLDTANAPIYIRLADVADMPLANSTEHIGYHVNPLTSLIKSVEPIGPAHHSNGAGANFEENNDDDDDSNADESAVEEGFVLFVLHHMFGNEECESALRREVRVDERLAPILEVMFRRKDLDMTWDILLWSIGQHFPAICEEPDILYRCQFLFKKLAEIGYLYV